MALLQVEMDVPGGCAQCAAGAIARMCIADDTCIGRVANVNVKPLATLKTDDLSFLRVICITSKLNEGSSECRALDSWCFSSGSDVQEPESKRVNLSSLYVRQMLIV